MKETPKLRAASFVYANPPILWPEREHTPIRSNGPIGFNHGRRQRGARGRRSVSEQRSATSERQAEESKTRTTCACLARTQQRICL